MNIQTKRLPAMLIASASHYVEEVTDELITYMTTKFYDDLAEAQFVQANPPFFCTVFQVNEYKETGYTMELWEQAAEPGMETRSIKYQEIPETEAIYMQVDAGFEDLTFPYTALFNYIYEHDDIVQNGFPRETYIRDESARTGYITEIQLPIRRKD